MTTTTKRGLIILALDALTFIAGFGGFILLVGSAGALERCGISESQWFVQSVIAFGLMGLGFFIAKVREVLMRYFRSLYKNNK